jgi:hypothetical protein
MLKKLISVLLICAMLPAFPVFAADSAKGTGSARPENRIETQKYSTFSKLMTEGYSRGQISVGITEDKQNTYVYFENFNEEAEYDINKTLLKGVLENEKTEEKINNWILSQYKKTGKRGVYYEAVNGYMSVVFGIFYDKKSDEKREPITSCWNLKTGEQLGNFSDLFYKDSDFLPAVNAKFAGSSLYNAEQYQTPANPKSFTFMKLTDSYMSGKYFEMPQNVSDEMSFWEAYKLMPAWEYFDMEPLFTADYRGQVKEKTADLYEEWYSVYGSKPANLKEPFILRSRFLSDDEITRRNGELEAIFDVIEQSDEYKNYKTEENFIEPTFDFSADGKTAIVYTPFGEFTKNGETIKSPATDPIMKPDVGFLGYVDYDMNGTAETITGGRDIYISDSKGKPIFTIPMGGFGRIHLWFTEKDQNGEVYGRIETSGVGQLYKIVDGKGVLWATEITENSGAADTAYLDRATVLYTLGALSYGELDYASGKARTDYNKLQKQISELSAKSPESYFALLNIEHGKTQILGTSNAEKNFFVNGKAVSKDGLPGKQITVLMNTVYDSDRERDEISQIIVFSDNKNNINCVPAFVTDKNGLAFPLTRKGIGNSIGRDFNTESKIIANARTPNPNADGTENKIPGYRFAFVDYSFYREGDKLIEYGSVPLSLERFKTIENSDKILKNIEDEGATIDSILYGGDGRIYFNCRKIDSESGKEIYINYTTAVYSFKGTYPPKTHWRMYSDFSGQWGVHLSSILETIGLDTVVYPDSLPGKDEK